MQQRCPRSASQCVGIADCDGTLVDIGGASMAVGRKKADNPGSGLYPVAARKICRDVERSVAKQLSTGCPTPITVPP